MKISTMNEAVTRVERGESPIDVILWLRSETGFRNRELFKSMTEAVNVRPNWKNAVELLFNSRHKRNRVKTDFTETYAARKRRDKIMVILAKHPGGISTTALLQQLRCDRNTLHTDMEPFLHDGTVSHSVVVSGKPTIWRLAK